MIAEATHVALATRHRLSCPAVPYRCTGVRVLPKSSVDGDTMFQVCMCIPRQLAEFGDRVVSKCRTVSCVHFTQCEEDDPDLSSTLKQADVLVAAPSLVHKHLEDLANIKWVHSYRAGVNELGRDSPWFLLTRHAGGSYGQLMTEYVVAQMVNWERQLYSFHTDRLNSLWNQKRVDDITSNCRMLSDLTIGILGVGVVGRRVAEVCKVLGMTVWGMTRTASVTCPHVDHHRQPDGLKELLKASDYVCNILPSTPQTVGLLDGDVLKSCAYKKSVLINLGRGDVVSEETIVKAIKEKWLGGAILDVFEQEPLPPESKLWKLPQVIITPHNSALATFEDMADFFVENLKLFIEGKELKHVVDWSRGY